LRETLELTRTGSWDWDIATDVVHWSDNLGPIHGLPRGAQPRDYEQYISLVHPDDRERLAGAVEAALNAGEGYEIELRTVPSKGEIRWIYAQASVLRAGDGSTRRIMGLTRDITDRKRAEEREAVLQASMELLTGVESAADLGRLADLLAQAFSDWCMVGLFEDGSADEISLLSSSGEIEVTQQTCRDVLRCLARQPDEVVLDRELAQRSPSGHDHSRLLRQQGLHSSIAARLGTSSGYGWLVVAASGARRAYDEADLSLMADLARQVAVVLNGAEARQEAESARREADVSASIALRLQEVTEGLAAAATTAEIADVIIDHGIPALSATTGLLGVLEGADRLSFVRSVGYGEVFPRELALAEPWPITDCVRERRIIELRDIQARRAAYSVPQAIWDASAKGTLVAVPLVVGDRAIGAIGFTRESSAPLSPDELRLVETLARQAAQALDRAALFEADRRGRLQAEGLQRVTSEVASAATMTDVATAVAVETLNLLEAAGVAVILGQSPDATVANLLSSCGSVAQHAVEEPWIDLQSDTAIAAAIRSQEPLFIESSHELARWPITVGVADELGLSPSIACVPFRVDGRPGALSVVIRESRRFDPADRTFLILLARVCEQGLLRAALYEREQSARTRSEILHRLAATLSGAASVAEVGEAFLQHAVDHVGAGSGSLMLADSAGGQLVSVALGGSGASQPLWLQTIPVDGPFVVACAFREGRATSVNGRPLLEQSFSGTATRFGDVAVGAYAGPLVVAGRRIGAFGLIFEREFALSEEDERLLATMADLCAQAIVRAEMYDSEHQIAARLQRAMLPDSVVRHPAAKIAASYRAGADAMEIGGDWYDTFALPDGRIGIAVGDVVGNGLEAAAAMGRLRSALAAYAIENRGPAEVLESLDRFVRESNAVEFATACYAVFDPVSGALRYASAGHPPMLLVGTTGNAGFLDQGRSMPLWGDDAPRERPEALAALKPGELLVAYSDGLVERRGEHIDAGLARLRAAAAELHGMPVEELCERLLGLMLTEVSQRDDVVLLALRSLPVTEPFRTSFPADTRELATVRAGARDWLEAQQIPAEVSNDVVLAISEACANAVEHAYRNSSGITEVEIHEDAAVLEVTVQDHGTWRPKAAPHPDRGRGLQLMRAVSESVDVNTNSEGTIVTIRFDLASQDDEQDKPMLD
jgi:PAS domain S-box-containing protein